MPATLTNSEQARLTELCGIVRKGLETFVEVGSALNEIRESGLYKARCSTFEAFVQIEFGMSRQHAYKQIAAAEIVAEMSPEATKPDSMYAALALKDVPSDARPAVMAEAAETARSEGRKPTVEHVKRAAEVRRSIKHEKPEDTAAAIVASTRKENGAGDHPVSDEEPEFASEEDWIRHEKREAFKAVANEPWAKLATYLEKLPLPPKWTREEISAGAPELPSGCVMSARIVHSALSKILEAKEASSAAA